MTTNEYGVSFWGDENVLKLIMIMVAKLGEYTKSHWIVPFKKVNFMVCELYLNETVTCIHKSVALIMTLRHYMIYP